MRITSSMVMNESVRRLQANYHSMAEAQSRVTTGLRFQRMSEDPSSGSEVVRTNSSLRALDQYRRNIGMAKARLNAEENALSSLTNVLQRGRILAVQQGSDTADAETRLRVKFEIDNLLEEAVRLGNTKVGEEFLFGGTRAHTAPFDPSLPGFAATPPVGERSVEIADGDIFKVTHSGSQAFLDTGALQALKDLSDALGGNDRPAIVEAADRLDAALIRVQGTLADVGARTNQVEVTAANLDALDLTLKTFRSEQQDADMEKSMADLVARQTTYQAALLSTSRIMGMSLANYLK